jgi:hypothetical protein
MTSEISKNHENYSKKRTGKRRSFTLKNHCPNCHAKDYRRTQRKGLLEGLLTILQLYPFRCRNYQCNNRFFKFGRGQSTLE